MWEWDEDKRLRTLALRGLDFRDVQRLAFGDAIVEPDDRRDYGEARFRAYGLIDDTLHMVVFTPRGPQLRLISLRLANRKERARWQRTNP